MGQRGRVVAVVSRGGGRKRTPQLHGKLIIELAELDALSTSDSNRVKRFISTQLDNFARKYEAFSTDVARRFIFIGTSNDDAPLRDESGGRRFLLERVEHQIDLAWLRTNARQLIGEAAHLESRGETFGIPREVWGAAAVVQEDARARSPVEELIYAGFLNSANDTFVTSADLVTALTMAKQNASAKAVAPVMKRLGFKPVQGRTGEWARSARGSSHRAIIWPRAYG